MLYGLPNADVLLSPLTTREAVLSSKIEGTQATLGEVLKYEAGERTGAESRQVDIQEILNYRRALRLAEEELKTRPFDLNLLLTIHRILLDSVRGVNKARGEFRKIQNWIGAPGSTIEQAGYVPPAPDLLPACLDNFEKYTIPIVPMNWSDCLFCTLSSRSSTRFWTGTGVLAGFSFPYTSSKRGCYRGRCFTFPHSWSSTGRSMLSAFES